MIGLFERSSATLINPCYQLRVWDLAVEKLSLTAQLLLLANYNLYADSHGHFLFEAVLVHSARGFLREVSYMEKSPNV